MPSSREMHVYIFLHKHINSHMKAMYNITGSSASSFLWLFPKCLAKLHKQAQYKDIEGWESHFFFLYRTVVRGADNSKNKRLPQKLEISIAEWCIFSLLTSRASRSKRLLSYFAVSFKSGAAAEFQHWACAQRCVFLPFLFLLQTFTE